MSKSIHLDVPAIKMLYKHCMDVFESRGMRPVAMLVLAAVIVDVHSRVSATRAADVLGWVERLVGQLQRGERLDISNMN